MKKISLVLLMAVFAVTVLVSCDGLIPKDTYTVSFDKNGGDGTTPGAITTESGSQITLPSGSGLSKTGYTFGGWSTIQDGGTVYSAGSSYTVQASITLWAKWESTAPSTPTVYTGFYQWPTGRQNPQGMLKIVNNANGQALLFMDSVSGDNYIGTVEGNNSFINVNLPQTKFYTIIAINKTNYESNPDQAERYSDITYFSNQQHFTMTVTPSSLGGAAPWILINRTNYWVSLNQADNSGNIYAVIPPKTNRATVPMRYDYSYDYIPHYFKELKYNGVVYALSESDDPEGSDTAYVRTGSGNTSFTTEIGGAKFNPSGAIKPAVLLTNSTTKTARAYFGIQRHLNGGADDLNLVSGDRFIFTGFEAGDNVQSINLLASGWNRIYVTDNIVMENGKVYKITFSGNSDTQYTTSVTVEDAEDFYSDN